MYNIYLVQCGMLFGDNEHPSAFLPYATGCLAAYAWNKPSVREQYDLKKILYKEEDIDSFVNELEDPFLVGFSCSVWNYAYNRSLAEKIKQQYPNCHILFGGHEITHDFEVLKKYPYVDFTIFGEGELAFSRLLEELAGTMDLTSVPSLCYRDQGQYKMTEIQAEEAENLVSPYLTGLFDSMLAENMEFMATIETVRGCPFNCAFCDGSMEGNVVRIFPLQRILDEIQWVSDHQFNVLFFADSNFGMSRRDVEIASWIAEKKALTGYPRKWDGALSKEKK